MKINIYSSCNLKASNLNKAALFGLYILAPPDGVGFLKNKALATDCALRLRRRQLQLYYTTCIIQGDFPYHLRFCRRFRGIFISFSNLESLYL